METRRLVRISKFLSLVLRHRPEYIGLQLDEAGWADVSQLLDGLRRRGVALSRQELQRVVLGNDKRRFSLSEDGSRIRASQGHSIPVDLGYEPSVPPEVLYHGTSSESVRSILRNGLRRGRRHDVHLSPDPETAVKVGRRHGRPVVLVVAAGEMHRDGCAFYLSENGVWLTDHVPPRYLSVEGGST